MENQKRNENTFFFENQLEQFNLRIKYIVRVYESLQFSWYTEYVDEYNWLI